MAIMILDVSYNYLIIINMYNINNTDNDPAIRETLRIDRWALGHRNVPVDDVGRHVRKRRLRLRQ
jgi:hypothetical protein